MRWIESDTRFYVSMGLFSILVFVVGVSVLVAATDVRIETREFAGFVLGFGLFMGSYFGAMAIYRLVS